VSSLASLAHTTCHALGCFRRHHGFIVEYAVDRDRSLGFHVDDSELTLNVCLGTEFTGGELFFRGVRCALHQQTPAMPHEKFDYCHRVGHGVIHLGRHRHGALPLLSGRRTNLIVWCRSSAFRRSSEFSKCSPACGCHEGVCSSSSSSSSAGAEASHVTADDSPSHASTMISSSSCAPMGGLLSKDDLDDTPMSSEHPRGLKAELGSVSGASVTTRTTIVK
jgi:hypothetical protein